MDYAIHGGHRCEFRGGRCIGDFAFDTTGVLGVSYDANNRPVQQAFPPWMTLSAASTLALSRDWHFLIAWVFVITRFVHAGIFVTSNSVRERGLAWFAGVLVLFAMWLYFALWILLVI